MSIWEMKVTSIRESTIMSTLTSDVLYSKLKTHELDVLARKHGSKSIALISQSSKSHDDNSSTSYALSSLSALTDEQLEQLPEDDLALLSTRFTKALQNVRSRRRGNSGPPRYFECGSLNHILPKCPKFLARIAKDEDEKEEKDEQDKKKHTSKSNKKRGYLNRKVVHRVLSALDQVNLSDVDMNNEDDGTPKGKKILIGLCLMATSRSYINSDLDSDGNNEVEPTYDELANAVEKLGTLLEKKNKKIKKHDALIESLNAEIARLNTLTPVDDSCKSCDLVYAEFTSLRDVHASVLEQLKAEKEKNGNHVCVVDEPTSCDNCNALELKLKDANARVDQLKNDFFTHEILSCPNYHKQKKPMYNICDNCSTLLKRIEYLQGKMGTKSLNQILEQKTSSLKHKTGLGFDPYAHSKNNAPTVVRSLGSGKIEICGEPKRMVFKSAGIISSTSTMNANVTSTCQVKYKVKYTCTHCGRDGHKVEFCFRLAKQQMKEKTKAMSNLVKARSFATRNMSYAKSDISHKNTSGVPTGFRHVSQYWIPKC